MPRTNHDEDDTLNEGYLEQEQGEIMTHTMQCKNEDRYTWQQLKTPKIRCVITACFAIIETLTF